MNTNLARHGLAKNRTMHVVDLENLFGGTAFNAAATASLAAAYPHYDRTHDQVVVGASCQVTAVEGALGWKGSRLVWMRGRDGADLCIADVLLNEDIERRVERVVIGSGDGLFAPVAAYLAARGVEVGVITRRDHLSRTLRLAAHWVTYLPEEGFQSGILPSSLTIPPTYRSAA